MYVMSRTHKHTAFFLYLIIIIIVATIIGGTAISRTPETDLGSEDTRTTTQKAIGSVDDSSR